MTEGFGVIMSKVEFEVSGHRWKGLCLFALSLRLFLYVFISISINQLYGQSSVECKANGRCLLGGITQKACWNKMQTEMFRHL